MPLGPLALPAFVVTIAVLVVLDVVVVVASRLRVNLVGRGGDFTKIMDFFIEKNIISFKNTYQRRVILFTIFLMKGRMLKMYQ